jgi:hypothetical protein
MKLYIFCVLLLFCSCSNNPDRDLIEKACSTTVDEVEKEYGVELDWSSDDCGRQVAYVALHLPTATPFSVSQARELVVNCTEMLLKNIHSIPALRLWLIEYPFPIDRVSFFIRVMPHVDDSARVPGQLLKCQLNRGIIKYNTIKHPTSFISADNIVIMHEESYEEAKRKVENEKNK